MADATLLARASVVRLPIATAAEILASAGATCTEASIRADVAAGAPVNADGTINLLAYGAWLVREHAQAGASGRHHAGTDTQVVRPSPRVTG